MIIVHGTFPIKPHKREAALDLMRKMSVASREEFGCINYEFYVGLSNPNTLLLFQEWESAEALQDHFHTDHMEFFLQTLPEVLDGELLTRRYEIQSVKELNRENELSEFDEQEGLLNSYRDRVKIIH